MDPLFSIEGCTRILLEKLPFLTKKADASGWTALHLAAGLNRVSRIRQLLKADPSIAYITAGQDNGKTALHVATAKGQVKAMEAILKHSPDCWEINTCDDRNLLHIAVDYERHESINFIMAKPWAAHLANEKDANGDTPLHLYAISSHILVPKIIEHAADVNSYNKENLTPFDMFQNSDVYSRFEADTRFVLNKSGARPSSRSLAAMDNKNYRKRKDIIQERRKRTTLDLKKMTETHMIVATLISTVTFTAAFTLPGGYDGNAGPNQGMAVLTRKSAFQAFVISNTIALICSTIAVFLLLFALMSIYQRNITVLCGFASLLLRSSVIAMLIAFTAGSYCVLDSKGLQITICIFGGTAIIFLYFLVTKGPTCSLSILPK